MESGKYIPYEDISVGDSASMTVQITAQMVDRFAELYNDTASFHVSDELAARTIFGRRICHGVHLIGFFSELMGKQLPGFGTIYLSHILAFKQPVFLGETITATIAVAEKLPGRKLRLSTIMTCAGRGTVIEGESVVKTYQ
ncbi:MAG: MaoC family dehydratase [Bacillota bacterium]|jgi:3-hydroxybutyryl-CoA dehydratase